VIIQLHFPATVLSVKEAPIPIEQEIRRVPELVCRKFEEEINNLILLGNTL
jgi:hypothetical protein